MSVWMAGGMVVGGAIAAYGSMSAADAQAEAAQQAAGIGAQASAANLQLQRDIYEQQRKDQTPWRETGQQALNQLAWGMGLPGYQQGQKTLEQYINELRPAYTTTQTVSTGAPTAGGGGFYQGRYYAPGEMTERWDGSEHGTTSWVPVESMEDYIPATQTQTTTDEAALRAAAQKAFDAQAPFQGQGVYGDLMRDFTLSDYQADPGYGFRLSEGLKALERSAAARGGLLSGRTMKGITDYSQGMASQEYQNAFNRFQQQREGKYNKLANVAGLGQVANTGMAQAAQNYGSNAMASNLYGADAQANAALSAGNARASSYGGMASGLTNALSGMRWPSGSTVQSPYSWQGEIPLSQMPPSLGDYY